MSQLFTRASHQNLRCLRGSLWTRQVVPRCFGAANSTNANANADATSSPTPPSPPAAAPPELSQADATTNPLNAQDQDSTPAITDSNPLSTEPPLYPQPHPATLRISAGGRELPPEHKIHVLGHDERSRFIAHALSGVYDSVQLIGRGSNRRYTNIERKDAPRGTPKVVPNAATVWPNYMPRRNNDASHIDQLVVTGTGNSAIENMKSVKDRVDEKSTICVMAEGLGVVEDMEEQVFKDVKPESRPSFVLGHMNHKLRYNRTTMAVKEINPGQTKLTTFDPWASKLQDVRQDYRLPLATSHSNFIEMMQKSEDLHAESSPYDRWLHFKLPEVIFKAAVEPVTVLLDLPYNALLPNSAARSMMDTLITEIEDVVGQFPEIEQSPEILGFLMSDAPKRICYKMINAKRDGRSEYVRLLQRGIAPNINYSSGYFLRRARHLNLELPMNKMMNMMVRAKLAEYRAKIQEHVPVIETSVGTGWGGEQDMNR